MAGTVTVTEAFSHGLAGTPNIHKIKWSWVCTAGGAADKVTTGNYYLQVGGVVTVPGAGGNAPSDNYDITITDPEGYDVLQGAGANRDTANTETAAPAAASFAYGNLTLNVSNAGNATSGTVTLYLK